MDHKLANNNDNLDVRNHNGTASTVESSNNHIANDNATTMNEINIKKQNIIYRIILLWIPSLTFMLGLLMGIIIIRSKVRYDSKSSIQQPPQLSTLQTVDDVIPQDERSLVKDDVDYDYFTSYMKEASSSRKQYNQLMGRIQNQQYSYILSLIQQQQHSKQKVTTTKQDYIYVRFTMQNPSSESKYIDIEITSNMIREMPHTIYTFLQFIQHNMYQHSMISPQSSPSSNNMVFMGLLSSQQSSFWSSSNNMMKNEDWIKRYEQFGYKRKTSPLLFRDDEIAKASSLSSSCREPYSIGFVFSHPKLLLLQQDYSWIGPELFVTLPTTDDTSMICFGRIIINDDSSWLLSLSQSIIITQTQIMSHDNLSKIKAYNDEL